MSSETLMNHAFIASTVTADDTWCTSHGATPGSPDLGAGIIYYGLAYATKAKTCVCLGSGGGFVPRLMRQAQRDLEMVDGRTILVDGAPHVAQDRKAIWGSPSWLEADSSFRANYPEIEIILQLTENALHDVFLAQQITIDYLHIDADHHYDGVKRDWDLYHPLVAPRGVITLHDTVNYREPCGVPQLVEEIRSTDGYEVVNLPIAYGTAIVKKLLNRDENLAASRSSLSAKPGRGE
jgi:hypothetical protein